MKRMMLYFLRRHSVSNGKMICLYCGHSIIVIGMLYSCYRHSVVNTERYEFNKCIANYIKDDMPTTRA